MALHLLKTKTLWQDHHHLFPGRFLCQFEQQPEEKAFFKRQFSHKWGEMKENIFTIHWNPNITIVNMTMFPVSRWIFYAGAPAKVTENAWDTTLV